jgi:hypothetical protein
MTQQRRAVLSLYSSILHAHRARLPDHMRQLGDSYVRYVKATTSQCDMCAFNIAFKTLLTPLLPLSLYLQ